MKKFYLLIFVIALILPVEAQSKKVELSGNLQIDSRFLFSQNNIQQQDPVFSSLQSQSNTTEEGKKSPLLGGLFSFILPGAGEFYSGSYLKAGIFVAVEAAVITTAIIYNNKGNNQTDLFQNYADQNWSVVKYAEWIIKNRDALGLPDIDESKLITNNDPSLQPWQRVNFNYLNTIESESSSFTHQLYPHGNQQYYELIGKYHQYSPGWAQFDPNDNDPHNMPPQMVSYEGMRGKANDYYNTASTAVIGIYINHFLSALDGVWSAIRFNNDLAVKARVDQINLGYRALLVPTIKVRYNF